jgi:small-conductance mechanosensitive channel
MEKLMALLNSTIFQIGETSITTYSVILFIFIIVVTLLISKLSTRSLSNMRARRAIDEDTSSLYIIERFLHYFILALGIVIGLASLGVDISHLALLATALSVGIGFGLQSIFNNFFSGIIILLERSLKVGDYIELEDNIMGRVIEINVRSTMIRTPDNLDILVPNSQFVEGRVTNWTLNDPHRRLRIPFGVAYGTDKKLVKKAVLEAAHKIPMTLKGGDKDPDVWLVNFGDSSLDFELIVWIDPRKNKYPGGVIAWYVWEIETSLNKYHIEIPFPQRDLHIKNTT